MSLIQNIRLLQVSQTVSRSFCTSSCLCQKGPKGRQKKKSHEPFDPRQPITGKHVHEYKKWGSKLMAEKLALHVVQPTGYISKKTFKFETKKEMIPEFIIPDLDNCELKPYVPYNLEAKEEGEMTPEKLFNATYAKKVHQDFKDGKISTDSSLEEIAELDSLKRR